MNTVSLSARNSSICNGIRLTWPGPLMEQNTLPMAKASCCSLSPPRIWPALTALLPCPHSNSPGSRWPITSEKLFHQHGPPLILKRDNGSIFNNEEVDAVLARWHVLPLNSPAYYPRYNGAIEKAISELKADLPSVLTPPAAWQIHQVQSILAALCLQQNTQPRRRLQGRSACEFYHHDKSPRYPKRQRLAIFQSILSDATATINHMEEPDRRVFHAAWREAMVRWLVCQNLLSLSQQPKCVTPFSQNVVS